MGNTSYLAASDAVILLTNALVAFQGQTDSYSATWGSPSTQAQISVGPRDAEEIHALKQLCFTTYVVCFNRVSCTSGEDPYTLSTLLKSLYIRLSLRRMIVPALPSISWMIEDSLLQLVSSWLPCVALQFPLSCHMLSWWFPVSSW